MAEDIVNENICEDCANCLVRFVSTFDPEYNQMREYFDYKCLVDNTDILGTVTKCNKFTDK